jgi:uncharacterized lipoprotein
MYSVKRHTLLRGLVPVLASVFLLGGCSWFHRDRTEYYKGAQETRPLEVPPDLDAPPTAKELVVPGSAAGSATAASTAPPASAALAVADTQLHVADAVQNTWQRVGTALDHAQLGNVSARDEATHSYVLDFDATVTESAAPQEHHWYSRVLHPFSGGDAAAKSQKIATTLRVSVAEDPTGATVSVVGNPNDKYAPDAARHVIQVLRERFN